MATLDCRVDRVVYNKEDFYILRVTDLSSNRTTTVRGNIYGISKVAVGVTFQAEGNIVQDAKYGEQMVLRTWHPWANTPNAVVLFLHNCMSGFEDLPIATGVANAFGVGAYSALTTTPAKVQSALVEAGFASDLIQRALLSWESCMAVKDASELLREGGLGAFDVQLAVLVFGTDTPKIVRSNPYRLLEIPGISFTKADSLAQFLGLGPDDNRRVEGSILWALQEATQEGHLFIPAEEILGAIQTSLRSNQLRPLSLDKGEIKKAVRSLVACKAITLEPSVGGLYLTRMHGYETQTASILASLLTRPREELANLAEFVAEYERSNNIELSPAQREAIHKLTVNRVLVLTGLPGTGKTTAIRALVRAFEASQVDFMLLAPTGIASKRLSAVTGHSASTIHRGLKYNGSSWGHNETNRLTCSAVIVDEVSMVDQELLYRLLVSLREDVRIVLVGDDAQLPSVGPGNVLRELASCPVIPNVRLTQIFRQSDKGEIVVNAHRINRGEPIVVSQRRETEFQFVRMGDEEAIVRLVVDMAAKLKEKNSNFQVLTAKYDGVVGVHNLNEALRDRLNPEGPGEWVRGDLRFRLGDRLMVIKNDHLKGIYNGDVGKLIYIKPNTLVVRVHGVGRDIDSEVEFDHTSAEHRLRLAYAVTVHKSQGNEFDTIILPIVSSQGRMLQRNLLYTAVTRARKRVWLIGDEAAIQKAIDHNPVLRRNTRLSKAVVDEMALLETKPVVPVEIEAQGAL